MAIPILASLISSAATQQGGGDSNSAPSKSAGLDPGGYAFELWFNQQRRKEEQENKDREMRENKRKFDLLTMLDRQTQVRGANMAGLGFMAKQAGNAEGEARLRVFKNGLFGMGRTV